MELNDKLKDICTNKVYKGMTRRDGVTPYVEHAETTADCLSNILICPYKY